jgi:hypothetical protein
VVESGSGHGLHPIGSPHGIEVMGLEDRAQQVPAIDRIIDDENFWFHEEPPFSDNFFLL